MGRIWPSSPALECLNELFPNWKRRGRSLSNYEEALDFLRCIKRRGCRLRWNDEARRIEAYRPCGLSPSLAKTLTNLLHLRSRKDFEEIKKQL